MKTFIFSALALGMMASCSNSEIDEIIDNGEPVAIQLSAGVEANVVVGTRAPITGNTVEFKPIVLGWKGKTEPVNYATECWTSTADAIKADADNAALTLTPAQYYDADGTVNTYMKAFYAEGATVVIDKPYSYTFVNEKGQLDVLVAPMISGNKVEKADKKFTFTHPLTQLKFILAVGDGFPDGVKIKTFAVNAVNLPIGIDLSTETPIQYKEVSSLPIDDMADKVIGATTEPVGSPVMVKPFAANTFTVSITTENKTYEPITVTLNDNATAGKAYNVTLTFKEKMSVSAAVTDWDNSGTGAGTVE